LGEISRSGQVYRQVIDHKNFKLPSSLRAELQQPWGQLLIGSQSNLNWAGLVAKQAVETNHQPVVISVGDVASLTIINQKIIPDLSIVDLKTSRVPWFKNLAELGLNPFQPFRTVNPAGSITSDLVVKISLGLHQKLSKGRTGQVILVKGEEDLAVLPAIILAPLESLIFYGQPNQGLVMLKLSEAIKERAFQFFQKLA